MTGSKNSMNRTLGLLLHSPAEARTKVRESGGKLRPPRVLLGVPDPCLLPPTMAMAGQAGPAGAGTFFF